MTLEINDNKFHALFNLRMNGTEQESWECDRDLVLTRREFWSFGECARVRKRGIVRTKYDTICDEFRNIIISSPRPFYLRFYNLKGEKLYTIIFDYSHAFMRGILGLTKSSKSLDEIVIAH